MLTSLIVIVSLTDLTVDFFWLTKEKKKGIFSYERVAFRFHVASISLTPVIIWFISFNFYKRHISFETESHMYYTKLNLDSWTKMIITFSFSMP